MQDGSQRQKKAKDEIKSSIKQGYRTKDAHAELYSKEYHEIGFSKEICPICGSRIDEKGMCACGAGGS